MISRSLHRLSSKKKLSRLFLSSHTLITDYFFNYASYGRGDHLAIYPRLQIKSPFLLDIVNRYNNFFNYSKNNLKLRQKSHYTDARITRVRFKPGYQRLWRHFRGAFAEYFNFKYLYQKQLTKYISSFARKARNYNYLSEQENLVSKVFIYSKLVPDSYTFDVFFSFKFLFLNGGRLLNKFTYIYKNDFLQLEISN